MTITPSKKLRTTQLVSPILDYYVAKKYGKIAFVRPGGDCVIRVPGIGKDCFKYIDYFPSKRWMQGGPLIEKEKISVHLEDVHDGIEIWAAKSIRYDQGDHCDECDYGETPLIAAMRLLVYLAFGQEVDKVDY